MIVHCQAGQMPFLKQDDPKITKLTGWLYHHLRDPRITQSQYITKLANLAN